MKKSLLVVTKHVNLILIFLIFAVVAAIFFFSRQIFFYKYEPEYYENLYYHSQWNYPNSTRGISDGPLYQFVGYRLVQGENPFDLRFEVPPFGTYLYGLAEKLIGNPYWVSIFFYLTSLVVLFLLLEDLFKNRRLTLLALLLFVTTPFVATQIRETMLDLPLMFLFLAHTFFFLKYLSTNRFIYLILAGIFLGLATGTKIGVYTPLTLLVGLALISYKKRIKEALLYPGIVFGGYVISFFFSYFIRHPNPIPWLRLHEKPLKFYLGSGLGEVDHFNQWKGIFLNTYQGWWQPGTTTLGDWSFVLPLGVIAMVYILYRNVKKKDLRWIYVSLLTAIFLVVNSLIPFFPRYLMPAIPLFILLTTYTFRKASVVLFFLALINLPFLNTSLNNQDPSGDAQAWARFISTRAYRELYRSITPQDRNNIPEEEFMELNELFYEKLGTRNIEVKIEEIKRSGQKSQVRYRFVYETKYGMVNHEPTFEFIRINNQWKLIWDWGYLWLGWGPESKILVERTAKDGRKMVYVIPRLMFDWNKHLNALSEVVGENTGQIDQKIRRVVPDKYPRFTGYLNPALGSEGKKKVLEIPGGSLVDDDSSPQVKIYVLSGEGARFEIPIEYEEKD